VLTIAIILRTPNFSYSATSGDIGRAAAEIFIVFGWCYKGFREFRELYETGWRYFWQDGSAFVENNLSFTYLVCVPLALISQAAGSDVVHFFTFVGVLAAWSYLLSLLMGFELTGPFVIMIIKMWGNDIARFMAIYVMVLVGHTVAFHSIQDPVDANGDEVFHQFLYELRRVFYILLGQIGNNNQGGSDTDVSSIFVEFATTTIPNYQWLSTLLLIGHVVFCFIVLINILISMMGDTYGEVKDNADREWRLSFAQIIFSIESEMGKKELHAMKYWATIGDKRYLQVIEVDKSWFDQTNIELASLDVDGSAGLSREEIKKFEKEARDKGMVLTAASADSVSPSREPRLSLVGTGNKMSVVLEGKSIIPEKYKAELDTMANIGPQSGALMKRMDTSYGEH